MNSYIKEKVFTFLYIINVLLYGLVYFYPYNEYGEPQIPIIFKLCFDLLLLLFFCLFGIKLQLNKARFFLFIFLLIITFIGLIHTIHTSVNDFLHYTVRNVILYSIVFFINIFDDKTYLLFKKLHYKVFRFVLYFGIVLFLFKTIGIKNPYGFHYWFWEENRLISTWLNPNSLGFYLLFYLIYEKLLKKKITPTFLLTIFSIFLTGSLTAILGLSIVFFYLFWEFLKKKKIKPIHILIFLFFVPYSIYLAINLGVFEYLLFKIEILFIKESSTYTSVSTRVQNLIDLYKYLSFDNFLSIILGDFSIQNYNRLDSQYLNIFYNYGLLGLIPFLFFEMVVLIKLYNGRSIYSKTMFVFSIWLFFIAFNLTAYIYRTNISIFYYIMLSFIFYIEEREKLNTTYEINK